MKVVSFLVDYFREAKPIFNYVRMNSLRFLWCAVQPKIFILLLPLLYYVMQVSLWKHKTQIESHSVIKKLLKFDYVFFQMLFGFMNRNFLINPKLLLDFIFSMLHFMNWELTFLQRKLSFFTLLKNFFGLVDMYVTILWWNKKLQQGFLEHWI